MKNEQETEAVREELVKEERAATKDVYKRQLQSLPVPLFNLIWESHSQMESITMRHT